MGKLEETFKPTLEQVEEIVEFFGGFLAGFVLDCTDGIVLRDSNGAPLCGSAKNVARHLAMCRPLSMTVETDLSDPDAGRAEQIPTTQPIEVPQAAVDSQEEKGSVGDNQSPVPQVRHDPAAAQALPGDSERSADEPGSTGPVLEH